MQRQTEISDIHKSWSDMYKATAKVGEIGVGIAREYEFHRSTNIFQISIK